MDGHGEEGRANRPSQGVTKPWKGPEERARTAIGWVWAGRESGQKILPGPPQGACGKWEVGRSGVEGRWPWIPSWPPGSHLKQNWGRARLHEITTCSHALLLSCKHPFHIVPFCFSWLNAPLVFPLFIRTLTNARNTDVLKRESEIPFRARHKPPLARHPGRLYACINSHF